MRKKSHISLAGYLADRVQTDELMKHRKAFCLGSILPDCKPSFLTTKHEFDGTFNKVQKRIKKLTTATDKMENNSRAYVRQLGEVIHYTADYFTFPHNKNYEGSLKDHCHYEKELKFGLVDFIQSGEATSRESKQIYFENVDALFSYIIQKHAEYMSRRRNVEEDCRFIVAVNLQIVQGILQLLGDGPMRTVPAIATV